MDLGRANTIRTKVCSLSNVYLSQLREFNAPMRSSCIRTITFKGWSAWATNWGGSARRQPARDHDHEADGLQTGRDIKGILLQGNKYSSFCARAQSRPTMRVTASDSRNSSCVSSRGGSGEPSPGVKSPSAWRPGRALRHPT